MQRLNLLTTAAGKLFLAVGNEIHVRDTMLLEPVHLDPQPGSTAVSPSPTLILSHPMPVDARPIEATDAYPSPINALRSGWLGEEEIVVSVDDGGQAWYVDLGLEEVLMSRRM